MKVAVLMSGGVDSSVTAILLKEQGYDIMGLTMVNLDMSIAEKAREVADSLGIEHKVIDLKKEFGEKVIDYFCKTYERGATPNPCVECNKYIKFGALLEAALDFGADAVATGHYVRKEFNEELNRHLIKKARDLTKDQSYFLYGLTQEQLARTIFPLGEYTKSEVREIARQKGLAVAESKESQEICFIEKDYRNFIMDRVNYRPGQFVDMQNRVLGKHKGIPFYTIGQRKGLGISAGRPVYVIDFDLENNRIIVDDEKYLMQTQLTAKDNNFIYIEKLDQPMQVQAKIRYKADFAPATIYPEGDWVEVEFATPQRAITQGQSVVYYVGDYVLGGGIIV